MNAKKKVALYPFNQKRHSVYTSTISLLKNNYDLFYNPETQVKSKIRKSFSQNYHLKYLYHKFVRPYFSVEDLKKVVSLILGKDNYDSDILKNNKFDLILASNSIPPGNTNYILDLEILNALSGYDSKRLNKEKIRKQLSDKRCKAIICWYDLCKKELLETIDCSKFKDKIKVIPFGFKSDKIAKNSNKNKKTTDLLFICSINNPQDFEQKGGIIALEVYKKLLESNKNITLTLRSYIPDWVKEKYSHLEGIRFIEKFLSDDEMKNLLINSDILLEPVPGLQLLMECMNYEIPVVSFDAWMIGELVKDNKTGFLIDGTRIFGSKDNIEKYTADFNTNYFKLYTKSPDENIISRFTEKSSELIKNKSLRIRMGKNAKNLLSKKGPYSLDKYNKEIISLINNVLKKE